MNKIIALAVLLTTSVVHADSLEDRTYWKAEMRDIEDRRKRIVVECGIDVPFEYIGKEALRADAEKKKYAPHVLCDYVVNEVRSQCGDGPKRKAAVVAKVKHIQCGLAAKRSVTVKGGVVLFQVPADFSGLAGWIRDELIRKI